MLSRELYKQAYKLIKNYDEIVIARHVGPDPDAVASAIALKESISLTFPEKRVFVVGAGVSKFKYLGFSDKVDFNSLTNALLIVLDVPNFFRVDGIEQLTYKDILKIDHHPKEDIVATVDLTSNDFSSTAEIVSELIFNSKLKMNKSIAEKLFIGIISDSERFLFKNTQPNTFKVVYHLVEKYNVDFINLYNNLYIKSINDCKFEAYIINNMTITDNNFGYVIISPEVLAEYNVDLSTPSVMINNFNFIKELYAWCFITYDERNEIYKVNIRSRGPIINTVASKFNGGGHAFASGARIYKQEDIQKLLDELDNACYLFINEQKENENN